MVTETIPDWPSGYVRLINSAFPPIDLFEDISDPADWEWLAKAEARTNPRVVDSIGQLDLVPVSRRVSGPGASYVMAPFVHCSPDRPGRFHDGHFGVFYAANDFETAVAETVHHVAKFLTATKEKPGWVSVMRELKGMVERGLLDIRTGAYDNLLDPDNYAPAQAFANQHRASGADGILYPSVRKKGGECIAAFWPDVPGLPVQSGHWRYHWDGAQIDYLREITLDGGGRILHLT